MMMNYNIMDLAMNNNNNNNNSSGCSWPPESKPLNLHNHHIPIIPSLLANYKLNDVGRYEGNMVSDEMAVKAKIMAHPLFTRLLTSYVNCQKVGAPSEVVARLEQVSEGNMGILRLKNGSGNIGEEPALDQFMEAYCEMLAKYEEELTKPFREAMLFLSTIDSQLKALTVCEDFVGQNGSYLEEELDVKGSPVEPQAEDEELKVQLLRKYSGYLGSLKQEFMKKKKSGKLPKEARQRLLDWWTKHYKWPYPSEAQKVALAESTGLDLKQINNWFINQRKRHWKPSEELHFMVALDPALPAGHTYYNMVNNNNNNNIIYNPFSMDLL